MKTLNLTSIRRTALYIAMYTAIAVPNVAAAGVFDRAKTRVQTATAGVATAVTQALPQGPVTKALQNVGQNLPDLQILEIVKELNLKEQLLDTIELMREMQADYQYFSGGSGCEAECAKFRNDLKGVFSDFLSLIHAVPALSRDTALIDNLERAFNVVDYIPPRALYLMWQALSSQMEELRIATSNIVEDLYSLPPVDDTDGVTRTASTSGSSNSGGVGDRLCEWLDDKPFVDLIQARLEMFAWRLKTAADLIPDVEVKANAGGSAGVAAGASAEASAEAGVGIKPTDTVKIVLKVIAYVPERINWAIKINTLRAKVACRIGDH